MEELTSFLDNNPGLKISDAPLEVEESVNYGYDKAGEKHRSIGQPARQDGVAYYSRSEDWRWTFEGL
jgi:hypothetical protein